MTDRHLLNRLLAWANNRERLDLDARPLREAIARITILRQILDLTGPDSEFACGRVDPALRQLIERARCL